MALKWYAAFIFIAVTVMGIFGAMDLFEDSFMAPMWHDIAAIVLGVLGLILIGTAGKKSGPTPPPSQPTQQ